MLFADVLSEVVHNTEGIKLYTVMVDFRTRRKTRRKRLMELLGGKCVRCGTTKNLHFDHIEPKSKNFLISDNLDRNEADLLAEVDKCQLLCPACHRQKTIDNWEVGMPKSKHGTLWMYKKYHCRCQECVKAMSEYYFSRKIPN